MVERGDRGKDRTRDHRNDGEPSRDLAHQAFDPVDHLQGKTGVKKHLAHEHEQRNRGERKVHDRGRAVAHHLIEPGGAAQEDGRAHDVYGNERKSDRQAHEQQRGRTTEEQQRGGLPGHRRVAGLYAADTASSRGRRSAKASRCMRNKNSSASSANAAGIGRSSHHSGITSVLIDSEPLARLSSVTRVPYQTKQRQHVKPTASQSHSSAQPTARQ